MRDPSLPRRRFEVDWALVAMLAAVAWGFVVGCSLTGCRRVETQVDPASGAAPAAPQRNADDCPGGVCHLPPKRPTK